MVRITSWSLSSIHIHEKDFIRFSYSDLTLQTYFNKLIKYTCIGRHSGLMGAHLWSKRSRLVEPWPGHCAVFLGKTFLIFIIITVPLSQSPSQPFVVSSRNAPPQERCVTRLKTAARETTSLHPGVQSQISTSELNAGVKLAKDQHPIQVGVKILLVTSCYGFTRVSSSLKGHLA